MKNRILLMLLCLMSVFTGFGQDAINGVYPNKIRVKLTPEAAAQIESKQLNAPKGGTLSVGRPDMDATFKSLGVVSMRRVFRYSPRFEERHRKYGLHLWYELEMTNDADPINATKSMAQIEGVSHSEPILEIKLIDEPKLVEVDIPSKKTKGSKALPTNDPGLSLQWHYADSKSVGGLDNAHVNLFEAWKVTMGSKNVIVNIVDGGVDFRHEDLAANMWINQAELNGTAGVDDDGNGYVDDVYGYNFVTNRGTINPANHGTHVAGTVGAVNNNNVGVAGVAGGSGKGDGVRLMSSQIFMEDGGVSSMNAEAIIYGADMGAVISQNSWGYTQSNYYEKAVLDAIDYFIAVAGNDEVGGPMRGGVCFFAAGNDGVESAHYPAYYENAVAICALNHMGQRASYSNYGDWVELSAPGGEEMPQATGVYSTVINNKYGYMPGTSMACPHVSGIAALILSKYGGRTFTPDMLMNRIYSSLHPMDQYSPDYAGKLGRGLIDATKSLASNSAIPPSRVTDLAVNSVAQDFVELKLTAPSDEDNGKANVYQVAYSTQAITAENFDKAQQALFNAKEAGVQEFLKVGNLNANTKYYFALRALDVWGNQSEISNSISATTTQSPVASLRYEPFVFDVNVTNNNKHSQKFKITNAGEGLLSYTLGSALVSDPRDAYTTEYLRSIYLDIDYGAYAYIGEDGLSGEFWSAIKFNTGDQAFNLSDISMEYREMQYAPGSNKDRVAATDSLTIEVYTGHESNPVKGQLRSSRKFLRGGPLAESAINSFIHLGEQIPLEANETFWVVVKFPAPYIQPISVNNNLTGTAGKCLYSVSDGANWIDISSIYANSSEFAYKLRAYSRYDAMDNFVSLDPLSGQNTPGDTTAITASFDASKITNGKYIGKLKVFSNDPKQSIVAVPYVMTVSGHLAKPVLSTKVIKYLGTIVGMTDTQNITITNMGLGDMTVTGSSGDANFKFIESPFGLPSGKSKVCRAVFSPRTEGVITGKITLNTTEGKIVIDANGIGIPAPAMTLAPEILEVDLVNGQKVDKNITISNTGKYTLEYSLPDFNQTKGPAFYGTSYGYKIRYSTSPDSDVVHNWSDMTGAEDITSSVEGYDEESYETLFQIPFGFAFDYYGKRYDTVSVGRQCYVIIGDNRQQEVTRMVNYNGFGVPGNPGNAVGALMIGDFVPTNANGRVLVKREPGALIVQYNNVGTLWHSSKPRVDVQMAFFYDGSMEFRYQNLRGLSAYGYEAMMAVARAGFENADLSDYFNRAGIEFKVDMNPPYETHYNYDSALFQKDANMKMTLRVDAPQPHLVIDASSDKSHLQPGESATINISLLGEDILEGTYQNALRIRSTDPKKAEVNYPITAHFTTPNVSVLSTDTLVFEQTAMGYNQSQFFSLINKGGSSIEISAINVPSGPFTLGEYATTCLPYSTVKIPVTFTPTSTEPILVKVTVAMADGQEHQLILKGKAYNPPAAIVTANADMHFTLKRGEHKDTAFTLKNTGLGTLNYTVAHSAWLKPFFNDIKSGTDQHGYYWSSSDEDASVHYDWIPLGDSAAFLGLDAPYFPGIEIDIAKSPFTFYDSTYTSIFISHHGFIAFNDLYDTEKGISEAIPNPKGINNFIAANRQSLFAGNFDDNIKGYVFYERLPYGHVITWSEVVQMVINEAENITFQIILYDDGRIKMQYKDVEDAIWADNGVIGIENQDGSDGLQVSYGDRLIKNNFAVMITPSSKKTLAAGESIRVPVRVDASEAFAGEYEGKLIVVSNDPDPDRQNQEVLVGLSVPGTEAFKVSDSINYGRVQSYCKAGTCVSYVKTFAITNTGETPVKYNALEFESPEAGAFFTVEGLPARNPIIIYPGKTNTYKVTFTPGEVGVKRYSAKLVLTGEDEADKVVLKDIILTAQVTKPATAQMAAVEQRFTLPINSTKKDTTFKLKNIGDDTLRYTFNIEYLPATAPAAYEPIQMASMSSLAPKAKLSQLEASTSGKKNNSLYDYNPAEYADSINFNEGGVPATMLFAPAGASLIIASRFQAGPAGFNLSHFAFRQLVKDNSYPAVIYIRYGYDLDVSDILLKEDFDIRINEDVNNPYGEVTDYELSAPIEFLPGEFFWICVRADNDKYQFGALAHAAEDYVYDTTGHVAVINEIGYPLHFAIQSPPPGLTWDLHALSNTKKTADPWLMASPLTGNLAPGKDTVLHVSIDPSKVIENFARVAANIKLVSNDPVQEKYNIYNEMELNCGPFIETSNATITVKETDTAHFVLKIYDREEEAFTVEMAEAYPNCTLTKLTASTWRFSFVTNYEDQGSHTFFVNATDASKKVSKKKLIVNVNHVNRPTTVIGLNDTTINFSKTSWEIDLNKVFVDPDGDALTFSTTPIRNAAAAIAHGILYLHPIIAGNEIVTITARELDSVEYTTIFTLTVTGTVATLTPITEKMSIYPNPIEDDINISFELGSRVKGYVRVSDAIGKEIFAGQEESFNAGKGSIKIPCQSWKSGTYVVQLYLDGKLYSSQVVVKP